MEGPHNGPCDDLICEEFVHELRVNLPVDKFGVTHNTLMERNAGFDAFDHKHFQGSLHLANGLWARVPVYNEFCDQ